jgi:hypothetical protein
MIADQGSLTAMTQRSVLALHGDMKAVLRWTKAVAEAAGAFEARWTLLALKRVNPDLHQALREQLNLFDEMVITGSAVDIDEHGPATCRGWAAAVKAMEAAPDDAYLVGYDSGTGTRIAIGNHKSADRVRDVYGNECVFFTADEVAGLLGTNEAFVRMSEVKEIWPGAEIVDIRKGER